MVYVVMSKVNNKRVFYYVKFLWKILKYLKKWDEIWYVILNKYEVRNFLIWEVFYLLDFKWSYLVF